MKYLAPALSVAFAALAVLQLIRGELDHALTDAVLATTWAYISGLEYVAKIHRRPTP